MNFFANFKEIEKACRLAIAFWKKKRKEKSQKLKNSMFDGPLIVNPIFTQTEFIVAKLDFAHIMHFIKPNVWCLQSLKILTIERWFPFNFAKKFFQGCHFVVDGPKNFRLLVDISFESTNIVLANLKLFLCDCY